MPYENLLKTLSPRKNIVPLVIGTISIFIIVSLVVSYQHEIYLADLSATLSEAEVESKKMHLNSEMMEISRKRSSLTAQILNTDDVFEQDELNQQLDSLASDFASAREKLMQLPLTQQEKKTLESHNSIVALILPAQRKAVELAMFQNDEKRKSANALLYQVVFPGQERLIDSFSQLVSIEQFRIKQLTMQSRSSLMNIRDGGKLFIVLFLLVSLSISIIVIMRILNIQRELNHSYQELERSNIELEHKVEERTGELSSMVKKLQTISEYDELTNLYNRRKFNLYIDEMYLRTKRTGDQMSFIMIDIDCFKHYNDNYGHIKGDTCLFEVANCMKNALPRRTDFIARYGGEEFAVILPSTSLEGAAKVAEQLRRSVEDIKIPHGYSNVADHVTISLGVTTYHAEDDIQIKDIIDDADRCLYQAKSKGRNRVEVMDPRQEVAAV